MSVASALFAAAISVLLSRTDPPCIEDPGAILDDGGDRRRFAAAFLLSLSGDGHPRYAGASRVLAESDDLAAFFRRELDRVCEEVENRAAANPDFLVALQAAAKLATSTPAAEVFAALWAVTFPEGAGVLGDRVGAVDELRRRRRVAIEEVNPNPIADPIAEILFTSNVLVSRGADTGKQLYWYDHPIPLDVAPADTELAHGLRSIDAAVGFEMSRHADWEGPATLALSLSSTHGGSLPEERALVEGVMSAVGPLHNLRVFCFDERLSRRLWDQVIAAVPVPGSALSPNDPMPVLGVSGPYGRHYSFLKALAPLWAICIDPQVRGTFKFDLDQSFPQEQLIAETGQSAFEHLTTERWGAQAQGASGEAVDLAMLAGGLVNQEDVDRSIFTPDVRWMWPRMAEDAIFFSPLVQAVSTEAEIVTRSDQLQDGVAQERIHVTGGTSAALVTGLRRWRPFTPACFGRAEDQAYLISALHDPTNRLGCVHEPGLVMRHDKADLVPEVIADSASGQHIGDLVRMRLFSAYGAAHKTLLDPFTGCFVSKLPITVAALRFAIHALELTDPAEADRYLDLGRRRLNESDGAVATLGESVAREREQWDRYYTALDVLEAGLWSRETWARRIRGSAQEIVAAAEVGLSS